jgi:hypothetical protein
MVLMIRIVMMQLMRIMVIKVMKMKIVMRMSSPAGVAPPALAPSVRPRGGPTLPLSA